MVISDKHRFAFIHIPKCAGTAVRHALMPFDDRRYLYFDRGRSDHQELGFLDFHHIPLAILCDHFPDDFALLRQYRSFTLLRDPFARFASSLHEYLHWNLKQSLAELSAAQVQDITWEVIEQLQMHVSNTPVTQPALIHFSRQSDYIELYGERIVSDVYAMEDLDAMMHSIGEVIGEPLAYRPMNQRMRYRSQVLQQVSDHAQRMLRLVAPDRIARPILNLARRTMVSSGLITLDSEEPFSKTFGRKTEDFVREFYARDFQLRTMLTGPNFPGR